MPLGGRTIIERMAWCNREVEKIRQRLTHGVSLNQAERLTARLLRVTAWQRATVAERDALVKQWLPLVHHIAIKFKRQNSSLSQDDLVGAGCVGLMLAAERYCSGGRARFKSYAYKAIWSHMVKECQIQQSMLTRPQSKANDAPSRLPSGWEDDLPAPGCESIYEPDEHAELLRRLAELPPRQREAIECKFLDRDQGWQSIPEVARQMGVSTSRVGQLIHAALANLRNGWPGLENNGDEPIAKAG